MVYVPHYRITMSGTLGPSNSPVEIWSNSFAMAGAPGTLLREDMPAVAAMVRGVWATNVAGLVSNMVRLTRVRCALVGDNGRVIRTGDGAFVQGDDLTQAAGSGAYTYPPQTSVAVTLETGLDDPCGRGRFFLPLAGYGTLGTDGRMSITQATGLANTLKNFVSNVNAGMNSIESGTRVVVASQGSATKGIPPANRPVLAVACGRVVDTQRRRRGALEEDYQRVPL